LAIIREKQGDYPAAIRLSQEAMKQGWRGAGWEGRIQRCQRKAANRNSSRNRRMQRFLMSPSAQVSLLEPRCSENAM